MKIGQPQRRVDGKAKVTGQLKYAGDTHVDKMLYAAVAVSSIARGQIKKIDLAHVKTMPGVHLILAYETTKDRIERLDHFMQGGQANSSIRPLASSEIHYYGQIVALVVADTLERAQEAASRLRLTYHAKPHAVTFDDSGDDPGTNESDPEKEKLKPPHKDPQVGDAETAFRGADVRFEAHYTTPPQHHNPIELLSTICQWDGPKLTIHEPNRFVVGLQHGVAHQLKMDPKDVRVICSSIGGHFGFKLSVSQFTAIAALAARDLSQPVKLVLTRPQCFTVATYRPETRHRIRLGARRGGELVSLIHETKQLCSRPDNFLMSGVELTSRLYKCPNVKTDSKLVHADRNTPGPMRAPPEVPAFFALECAIDELAYELKMDPIELRRRNDTSVEPIENKPYSSRPFMACWDQAAKAFGWKNPRPEPGTLREGDWLIGWGAASSVRATQIAPAMVALSVTRNGSALLRTAHHEIGNGITTLIAQRISENFGFSIERVRVELGDTSFPPASISGGSSTTTSLMHAVQKACDEMKAKLRMTGSDPYGADGAVELVSEFTPPGAPSTALDSLKQGKLILSKSAPDTLSVSFGAQFVEVRVHAKTGEIRVPRMVGAFAAGRIMNPLLAESQLMGGMVWGLSSALLEATVLEPVTGGYINNDLSEYLVPVHADIGSVRVLMVEDDDEKVNPLHVKGLGETGIIGVNAAIANAVYHATQVRVRDLPIRLDKLI